MKAALANSRAGPIDAAAIGMTSGRAPASFMQGRGNQGVNPASSRVAVNAQDGARRLRIVMPIHSFDPGGVERVGLRLAAQWQADGHGVAVILGRPRGVAQGEAPILDYHIAREWLPTGRWQTVWMIARLHAFLRREIRAGRAPDIVFCPGNTYTIVCAILRLLLGPRCPTVVVKISNDLVRTDLPRMARPFYRAWLRIQGRVFRHFIALSDPMAREIVREMRVSPAKVEPIPSPLLTEAELARMATARPTGSAPAPSGSAPAPTGSAPAPGGPPPAGARPVRYLAVGRLAPQKNYPLLLEAFARAAGPADSLTIAGTGGEAPKLARLAERLGIAGRIVMLGHVPDVPALFADADVGVLSSDYEGLPAVVVEALAAGLPVAATDCCASMGWLLGHGAFGVLALRRDTGALAAAMRAAAVLPVDRAAARAQAAQFSVERSSREFVDAMRRVQDAAAGLPAGRVGAGADVDWLHAGAR